MFCSLWAAGPKRTIAEHGPPYFPMAIFHQRGSIPMGAAHRNFLWAGHRMEYIELKVNSFIKARINPSVQIPHLDIHLEDMITIFRGPQDMGGRPGYRVDRPSFPVSSSTDIEKCAATVTNGPNSNLKKTVISAYTTFNTLFTSFYCGGECCLRTLSMT